MKPAKVFLFLFFLTAEVFSANITIVAGGFASDVVWQNVATGMGHTATIQPETILDNNAFFATTDVLVTSAYPINLSPARIAIIIQFMQPGKSVYLQSEYDQSFIGNQAYQTIVNTLGGSFSWIGTVSGVLAPMNVLGTLATTPITIPPLTYFWYGCNASVCNNFDSFLEFGGQYFGFTFCPPATGTGRLMTTSDQDWIIQTTSTDLIQNMITMLLTPPGNCGFTSSTISLGNDTTLCIGDHLLLGAGISATSYLWSTGATTSVILVDTSATYWLQISAAGCTAYDTINVTFNPCSINASFLTVDSTICPGTCTDFTNFSVNAASYQWFFPGANPSVSTDVNPSVICYNTPGVYDVTLIATNGALVDTLVISNCVTVYPFPAAQGITQNGDTLTSIQGAVSYQWYHDGKLIPGATDYFYVAQFGGNFNVVCTDVNGCEVEAVIFDVVAEVQLLENGQASLVIFPNPVEGKLAISNGQLAIKAIFIYNSIGELVVANPLLIFKDEQKTETDVSKLSSGMYWIELITQDKTLRTKLIKK
jgi:PKD repeat protein